MPDHRTIFEKALDRAYDAIASHRRTGLGNATSYRHVKDAFRALDIAVEQYLGTLDSLATRIRQAESRNQVSELRKIAKEVRRVRQAYGQANEEFRRLPVPRGR